MKPRPPQPQPDADALLRALVSQKVVPLAPGPARALRAQVLARIEERRRLATDRRRFPGFRRALWFVAAACVPLLLWGGMSLRSNGERQRPPSALVTLLAGSSEIARDGTYQTLQTAKPTSFESTDELSTGPDGLARALLPTGSVVRVGPQAKLRFATAGAGGKLVRDRLDLVGGRVDVEVPKLARGEELSVRVEGVTVVVHGTKFSVERTTSGPRAGEIRIGVTEGKVAVSYAGDERLLMAGESLVLASPSGSTAASAARAAADEVRPPDAASLDAGEATSTLSDENALLSEALRRRRQGDSKGALGALNDLLRNYPRSPLAETARVERLRAIDAAGTSVEVRREAEGYLNDYPRGFARQDAQRMLLKARAHAP